MTPTVDINQQAVELLPRLQRKVKWIIFARAMQTPNARLNQLLQFYTDGSIDSGYWSSGTTYSKGDYVRTFEGVYESIADGNTANPVTNTLWWVKVLPWFIGAKERLNYNGRYLTLTYALNRHFGTTFVQPPYPSPYGGGSTWPDIYITTNAIANSSFVMYPTGAASSKMYPSYSTGYMFDPPAYATASTFKYTIHFPLAVFNSLGSSAAIREAVVRRVVDLYNTCGIDYEIVTY
jgi:hypothetical protein